MILATDYFINAPDIDEQAQEFNIFYKKDSKLEDIIAFVEKYQEHRIIFIFEDKIDYKMLDIIKKIHPHISVRLSQYDLHEIPLLQERFIPFFLDSSMPAYNYTILENLIDLGVSDVYIADDLFYDLNKVAKVCRYNNIRIRVILNHIPSTSITKGINPKSPFITPQMRKSMERYVAVAEFDLGEIEDYLSSLNKLRTLIKIWFKNEYWQGQLSEINKDVKISIPCANYIPDTSYKWNCRRHCNSTINSNCKRCEEWIALANTLYNKNIIFRKPKSRTVENLESEPEQEEIVGEE